MRAVSTTFTYHPVYVSLRSIVFKRILTRRQRLHKLDIRLLSKPTDPATRAQPAGRVYRWSEIGIRQHSVHLEARLLLLHKCPQGLLGFGLAGAVDGGGVVCREGGRGDTPSLGDGGFIPGAAGDGEGVVVRSGVAGGDRAGGQDERFNGGRGGGGAEERGYAADGVRDDGRGVGAEG